jgi:uncharacterized protein YndB with AHSA1/START domain
MTITPHPVDPELDLELVRDIPVTPAEVFAAWTDPVGMKEWFCPKPVAVSECAMDLRPGGGFHTVMLDPEGTEINNGTGCILDIVPGERLVWTTALTTNYRPQTGPMPFTAILEFTPNGSGGCQYRAVVVHQDADGAKQHADMGFHDGWSTVVDQLVEHISSS